MRFSHASVQTAQAAGKHAHVPVRRACCLGSIAQPYRAELARCVAAQAAGNGMKPAGRAYPDAEVGAAQSCEL